jgi:hypothetical protein
MFNNLTNKLHDFFYLKSIRLILIFLFFWNSSHYFFSSSYLDKNIKQCVFGTKSCTAGRAKEAFFLLDGKNRSTANHILVSDQVQLLITQLNGRKVHLYFVYFHLKTVMIMCFKFSW